ncbi:MAG TPA: hypothetical protein VK213_08180 [Bacteroidales bacterium]|nr:hypothetical protein [Bacteroidales bacterium]
MKSFALLCILLHSVYEVAGYPPDGPGNRPPLLFGNELNSNPVTGEKYRLIIKINTLQVLFSEAPVSLEIFGSNDNSHQFQAGIIFPLEEDSFLQDIFNTSGANGYSSDKGVLSYRTNPYNNHGLSFKYEFRKYYEGFYVAPQLMYKYIRYDNLEFNVSREGETIKRNESKFTKVFGIGLIAGRQTYFLRQATDWYVGIGIRGRNISVLINEAAENINKEPYSKFSVYPFINIGFRTGLIIL